LLTLAVNVTGTVAQIGPAGLAANTTAGVRLGFTAILIVLDAAVLAVRQVPPAIVMVQVTVLPFAKLEVVKVFDALFCTGLPLTRKV